MRFDTQKQVNLPRETDVSHQTGIIRLKYGGFSCLFIEFLPIKFTFWWLCVHLHGRSLKLAFLSFLSPTSRRPCR